MTLSSYSLLFIGLGGAGQRHARIFRKLLPQATFYAGPKHKQVPLLSPTFEVDVSQSPEDAYSITRLPDLKHLSSLNIDLAVISVPTSLQSSYAISLLEQNISVLLEKPGFCSTPELLALNSSVNSSDANLFFSFQRRFHPCSIHLCSLFNQIDFSQLKHISLSTRSYLPDFHPYEDFRDLYAARVDLGGGVLRTECHELELIFSLLGKPSNASLLPSKAFKNPLDVEDTIVIDLEYSDLTVNATLSFASLRPSRQICLYLLNSVVVYDYIACTVSVSTSSTTTVEKLSHLDNDAQFQLQAEYIISNIYDNILTDFSPLYSLSSLFDQCPLL